MVPLDRASDDDGRRGDSAPDQPQQSTTRAFLGGSLAALTTGVAGCLDGGNDGSSSGTVGSSPTATSGESPTERDDHTATGTPPAEPQWGEITYPLTGNLRSSSGTLVIHFRIEVGDLDTEPGPWYLADDRWYRFFVSNVQVNEENGFYLVFRRGSGRGWMHAALGGLPDSPSSIPAQSISESWEPYEEHWVAFTWDEEGTRAFWLDGQLAEQQGVGGEGGIGRVTDDGRLVLGARKSAVAFYGVHVLDRPLPDDDLRTGIDDVDGLFERRQGTLLLDRFAESNFAPDGERQTDAIAISGFSGETGGTPTDACRFVDTPHGRALRAFTPPADADIP